MRKTPSLSDCSLNVENFFGPILSNRKLTDSDLIKLNAIASYAAFKADKTHDTVAFFEAASQLKISGFDYSEFNPDNQTDIFYDAWWASDLNSHEWLEFSVWCQQQLIKQQMQMRISIVAYFLTQQIPQTLRDSFEQWRTQSERGELIKFWRKESNYLEALKSTGKSSHYLLDLASALNEIYNAWQR
ncbi:hypothetical protein NG799_01905 [Laspinema sp. D1]|uniref:Uncharacterized protein n=2 Tax=Laspinema TaxID=2584823 RepID=A0ABT2MMG1_9CYAN|nr:hypothetical protein [Laspinema sp. D3b]MCT7965086.1 hypothetical protein [Laspinema sp. D2a]MCT7977627.1 hypothetical protein [Laspinema sp. D3b]